MLANEESSLSLSKL